MPQSDYNLGNQGFAPARQEINEILEASQTLNSGSTEPNPTFKHQLWMDESTGILKQRNEANTVWISIAEKSGSTFIPLVDTSNLPFTVRDDKVATTKWVRKFPVTAQKVFGAGQEFGGAAETTWRLVSEGATERAGESETFSEDEGIIGTVAGESRMPLKRAGKYKIRGSATILTDNDSDWTNRSRLRLILDGRTIGLHPQVANRSSFTNGRATLAAESTYIKVSDTDSEVRLEWWYDLEDGGTRKARVLGSILTVDCERVDAPSSSTEPDPPDPTPDPDPDPDPTPDPDPDPPPTTGGTLIFGPSTDLSDFTLQRRSDNNIKVVNKDGQDAIRLYLTKSEPPPSNWGGRYRAEIRLRPPEGWAFDTDYAIEFEAFVPTDNARDGYDLMMAQWHGAPDQGEQSRNAALACRTDGRAKFKCEVNYDPQKRVITPPDKAGLQEATVGSGNFGVGRWSRIRVESRLNWNGSGHQRIFIDGNLVGSYTGITAWRDDKPPYFKIGLYTFAWTASWANQNLTSNEQTLFVRNVTAWRL